MWPFPGNGPSQRLGDGNGIFNKWPGKLLIIVPFLELQSPCPGSLFQPCSLIGSQQKSIVQCCAIWFFIIMSYFVSPFLIFYPTLAIPLKHYCYSCFFLSLKLCYYCCLFLLLHLLTYFKASHIMEAHLRKILSHLFLPVK